MTLSTHASHALMSGDSLFRAIFEQSPVSTQIFEPDGETIAVNRAWEELWGATLEQIGGYNILQDQQLVERGVMPYIERGFAGEATEIPAIMYEPQKTVQFQGQDISARWVRAQIYPLRDQSGAICQVVLMHEDITEQRQAEVERTQLFDLEWQARAHIEQLAAERAAILGQLSEGIILTDPAGSITFVNEAAHVIHGVAKLGGSVETYSDTYHLYTMDGEPYPPEQLPLARAVLHGEAVIDAEWLIRRPDGTEIVAQGSATPLLTDDGARLGAVLTVRDVSAQHRLEQQKDEFLSAVAHDLRTPLTTIKGRVQILQRQIDLSAITSGEMGDGLAKIESAATRMITLISELLEVANIQLGRPLALKRAPTDLVAVAKMAAQEHQPGTDSHTLVVKTALADLTGSWDSTRMGRVLANLLSNAIKYSPYGGEIMLEVASEEPGWAMLTVTDHGVGVPAEDLPFIFDRFHRGGNVSGKIPGTGVGLAAVREIIAQHGGSISVESREGAGTTFRVRLPINWSTQ